MFPRQHVAKGRWAKRVNAAVGIFMIAVTFSSCSRTSTEPAGEHPQVLVGERVSLARGMRDLAVTISSAEIVGDVLRISVLYGGGCGKHTFAAVAANVWLESDPVQTYVTLIHDSDGDPCRALKGEPLHFDLTPMKRSWQRSYGRRAGAMIIHLTAKDDLPHEERPGLRYNFSL